MKGLGAKVYKKSFWLIFFITLLGFILRLIFIDKPEGLWNDEYVSWAIASVPFGKRFIEAVLSQCHMPFYYLYLKFFIHFFGNGDFMLRLTSVITGVLSIVSMYFVGKEFKDEKTGVLCAAITSFSSFLIYFSQEVRFYSILFLFSSLALLFTFKLLKNQSKWNLFAYVLFNFLIIFTHSIGFVFVILNLMFVSYVLAKLNPNYRKPILWSWGSLAFLTLLNLPLLFRIFTAHPYSQWWSHFAFSKLGFLVTDYFSPILTNIVSAPDNFFYNFTFGFVVFALIPSAIAVAGFVKGIISDIQDSRQDESSAGYLAPLATVSGVYLLVLIVAAITGKLMFITKYSIEIYPILILIVAYGLLQFNNFWRKTLIFSFCFLNLLYVFVDKNSAPRLHRPEGHKIVAQLLKNSQLRDKDFVVLTYYPKERFEKYFDFSKYNTVSIDKNNFLYYLGANSKDDFISRDKKHFDSEFNANVLDKIKSGKKLCVVLLKDVSIYSPVKMSIIEKDKKLYKNTPFMFLAFSQVKNQILDNCLKSLQILRIEDKGSWMVVTFNKK